MNSINKNRLYSIENFTSQLVKTPIVEFDNEVKHKNPKPRVSILLTTYNHKEYIRNAIDSILEQNIPFEYEVIIGDDDSTDGTRDICIEYARKHPDVIRLFLHKRENNIKVLGKPCLIFQLTYNLFQSRGEYIAFLSGDDYWGDKDKIIKQVAYLDGHKECSICFHSWAKLHNDTKIIERVENCDTQFPMPLTWMVRNIFKEIPIPLTQVLQEDDYMLFMLKTHGTIDFIKDIKPAIYRVHETNTWLTSDVEFKRKSEINTAVQILSTYSGTTHEHLAKVKLFKTLKKYVSDKRTKSSYIDKLFLKTQYQLKYKLTPSIVKLELERWTSRFNNKFTIARKKIRPTLIKLNHHKLNQEKVTIVANASIVIDSGIYKSNNRYILNSFFGENKIKTLSGFGYTNIINETDYFCSIQHGPWDNYYHWYIDSLPRIWGLHKPDLKKLPTIKLFLSKMIKTEDEKILQAILPDNVVIVKVPRKTLVKGNHAIYLPFLSKDCSGALDKEYLAFYLQQATSLFNLNAKNNYPSKIYISRKNAEKRKFLNENEVIELVKNEGYTVVELEKLNIAEQAALFYYAKKIVAQHGAALTNLLYAQHTSVVEIFHSPNQHLNHYRDLCSQKELDYTPIYLDGKDKNENLSIDLNYLKTIL